MDKLFQILDSVYSKDGLKFQKSFDAPLLGKVSLTVSVSAKSPTNFNFEKKSYGYRLTFEPECPIISISQLGIKSKLLAIDITKEKATFVLNGFPDIAYSFT